MLDALHSLVDYYADLVDQERRLMAAVLALPFLLVLLALSLWVAWLERGEPGQGDAGSTGTSWTASQEPQRGTPPTPPERSVWQLHPQSIRFLKAHGETIALVLFYMSALAVARQFVN
ncbi:hypothetical protein WAA24_004330 [Stenotrophomonas maltophilia]